MIQPQKNRRGISTKMYNSFTATLKEFEDTKGVIRIRKSKKNRQHNG